MGACPIIGKNMKKLLEKVVLGNDLTLTEARKVFSAMFDGCMDPAMVASFLTALKVKGESVDELSALVKLMRKSSVKIPVKGMSLDTCGTGGKKVKTFNISTCVSFVLAACGVKIAKHGNRSFSGKCGSADVLEGLGVSIDASYEKVAASIEENGFGFMFAPKHHPIMKNVVPIRRALGIRTIFNFAGPLTNPANSKFQLLGVCEKSYCEIVAGVLKKLGSKRAMVVWGEDVYDEISITGKTYVTELKDGKIKSYTLTPKDFGLKKAELSLIKGGSVAQNVKSVMSVLKGNKSAKLDIVLANAAAGLLITGKVKTLKEGVKMAKKAIDSGDALDVLEKVKKTNK